MVLFKIYMITKLTIIKREGQLFMAGINVKQFQVFKIGTDILKMADWNLKISKDKAMS